MSMGAGTAAIRNAVGLVLSDVSFDEFGEQLAAAGNKPENDILGGWFGRVLFGPIGILTSDGTGS